MTTTDPPARPTMHHVPLSCSTPRWPGPRALSSSLLWLALLGCPAGSEGDDLPPGAFTTGGDELVDPSDTEDITTTTDEPSDDTTTTTTTTSPPDTGSSDDGPPLMPTYAVDIQPIWTANCLTAGVCHDADGPQATLDLESEGGRDRLCSNNSTTQTSIALVDCEGADPDASWLYSKLTGDGLEAPGAGSLMPSGGMLSAGDLAIIEAWIEGGALP